MKISVFKDVSGNNIPHLTDEQLNRIFTVAIKPKEHNQKNTIIQLFRKYRSNHNKNVEKGLTFEERSIEKHIVQPVAKLKNKAIRPEVGFGGLVVNPMASTETHKEHLWAKQPNRPVTRAKARHNAYEDRRKKTLLNRSDYR